MHLLVAVRSIKHNLDRFIGELQGKYLPYQHPTFVAKDNPGGNGLVQMSVRPMEIYELVFPKQHLQTVMKSISCFGNGGRLDKQNFLFSAIRTALGYKPLPTQQEILNSNVPVFPIFKQDIDCRAIGIKEDAIRGVPDHPEQMKFEGL